MDSKRPHSIRIARRPLTFVAGSAFAFAFAAGVAVAQESIDESHHNAEYPAGPPHHRMEDPSTFPFRDLRGELKNKTTGTFTVTAFGDFHISQPVAKRMSPALLEVFRGADITVGNYEQNILARPRELAQDASDLGFDLLAPGEDDTLEGLEAREKYLGDLGIKVAGAGRNLTEARRPVFKETAPGLVSFLHACPGAYLCGEPATNGGRGRPRPGVNGIKLTVWNTVTQEQFNQLKAIRESILDRRNEPGLARPTDVPVDAAPDKLSLFGTRYRVGEKPGEILYELDGGDEQAQTLAVRNAKEISDFAIFHMHTHQNRFAFQQYSHDNYPVNFVQPFVRKLIDNGLDMYVGSGVHSMQGIEIYKGRPIFYNLGNIGVDVTRSDITAPNPQNLTNPERGERLFAQWWDDDTNNAYIARTTYKDGRLTEIRIYPVDNGLGRRPWSREHVPTTPTPERARHILQKLQEFSAPFGTKISIENNIGIIRVAPEATTEVGGDLQIPGRQPRRP